MSKFHVDLCLPPTDAKQLPEAIATAMAPFRVDQPGDWSEDWIWDWWHINSYEDSGDFAVRAEQDGDPRLIWEPTFPNGDLRERAPLRCDGGPRGLLDFDITRSEAVARARATWEAQQADFRRLQADHPPARPLTAFLARHEADPASYPRERAVAEHHAQPLVRALNQRSAWERYPSLDVWVLRPDSDPITKFTRDPEPEIEQTAVNALLCYALVTLDGPWIQRDRLGPFASPQPDEAAATLYAWEATAYLENLDENSVIVRLLCHG
jgi:hypothetical protein